MKTVLTFLFLLQVSWAFGINDPIKKLKTDAEIMKFVVSVNNFYPENKFTLFNKLYYESWSDDTLYDFLHAKSSIIEDLDGNGMSDLFCVIIDEKGGPVLVEIIFSFPKQKFKVEVIEPCVMDVPYYRLVKNKKHTLPLLIRYGPYKKSNFINRGNKYDVKPVTKGSSYYTVDTISKYILKIDTLVWKFGGLINFEKSADRQYKEIKGIALCALNYKIKIDSTHVDYLGMIDKSDYIYHTQGQLKSSDAKLLKDLLLYMNVKNLPDTLAFMVRFKRGSRSFKFGKENKDVVNLYDLCQRCFSITLDSLEEIRVCDQTFPSFEEASFSLKYLYFLLHKYCDYSSWEKVEKIEIVENQNALDEACQ